MNMGIGKFISSGLVAASLFFATLPTSTTYQLNSYGVGSGGGVTSSGTYSIEGTAGETSTTTQSSGTYSLTSGMVSVQQVATPAAPTLVNSSNWYNKLHLTLANGGYPSDTTFAIAISTDGFSTITNYVQNDNSVGTALGTEDYQTYTTWGAGSGFDIIGLNPSTTYTVKVKAFQGNFTESGYSATDSEATVGPQLTFSLSTNSLGLNNLLPGSVISASQTIDVTFATNADSGGNVYVNGLHAGLYSALTSNTILSATADLTSVSRGFGAQVTSVTQSGGGPLAKVTPYDGSSANVGILDTAIRPILSATAPITGGSGSVLIKAKSHTTDQAAPDYTETITLLASASF
jgi:hypothetical protein